MPSTHGQNSVLNQIPERAHTGGRDHSCNEPHDLAKEVRKRQTGNDPGKENKKREQGKNEVVCQRRGKRHGVILFHVANHIDRGVLEVK